ncbi:chalcone-flavanone isomerase-domain-containing protein [Cunninghamella echinulata]|nr:chalcone-flavanone isomerase-domain-containing protein [Cunninghamella echinulata]
MLPLRPLVQASKRQLTQRSLSTFANRTINSHVRTTNWKPIITFTTATALGITSYYAFNNTTVYSEAQQKSLYAGTLEDPVTKLRFPIHLHTNSEWKRLIGFGARQVSFLNLNVYVVGLYMKSEDIGKIQALPGWKDFNKTEFLKKEDLAIALLNQPVDIAIRIVPVRNTNTQHLRDGFTRSLLQRMRNQSESMTEEEEREILDAIKEFKTQFVNAKVKKDTEFIFTKTKDGQFKMEHEGKDMGTVNNQWLAVNFIMTYLNPETPASELALQDIATGFDKLMNSASSNTTGK